MGWALALVGEIASTVGSKGRLLSTVLSCSPLLPGGPIASAVKKVLHFLLKDKRYISSYFKYKNDIASLK
jgi:hypothetical protein